MIFKLKKHWEKISKEMPEEEQTQFLKETIELYKTNPSNTIIVYYTLLIFSILLYYLNNYNLLILIIIITIITLFIDTYNYLKKINNFYNKWR